MICRIYDVPGATLEQYEEVSGKVGMERPEGAHVHIAGRTDRGLQVIEVWDSQAHIDRFMDAGLGKAMQAAQLPEPTITEFEHKLDWVGAPSTGSWMCRRTVEASGRSANGWRFGGGPRPSMRFKF